MKEVFSKFAYTKLDHVIAHARPNFFMATLDLQSAYRAVPINPDHRRHFGLTWNFVSGEKIMCDNFLGFDTRIAPYIFDRLTDSVSHDMIQQGYTCFNYLDDFMIIGPDYNSTVEAQLYLIALLRRLGFYISWPKTSSPNTTCKYLGIMIDSVDQKVYLPQEELNKLHHELQFWSGRKTSTLKQMQVLCGTLNYCRKVVRGGRIYIYHMLDHQTYQTTSFLL